MSSRILAIVVAAIAASVTPTFVTAGEPALSVNQPVATEPSRKGHIETGGVRYYYEIRGEGEPLLLLHGGLGSIDMFAPVMPMLSGHRQVIGVDLQGHGRTPLGKRPISLEAMGADMGKLVSELGYKQVDVLGYSMGGGVALQMAAQSPDKVRRLVIASAPFARKGFFPEMIPQQESVGAGMAEMMKDTPMFISYKAVAPDVSEFPRLLDAMGDLMRRDYDYSDAIPKLTMPVMLVFGDSDMVRPEHIVEFYQKLGGGLRDAGWMRENMSKNRLAILPDLTHYEAFASPTLTATVLPFLDGKSNAPNWAEQVKK